MNFQTINASENHYKIFDDLLSLAFAIFSTNICLFFTVTFYQVHSVLQAFVLTMAVTIALTVYTLQSKRDFSSMGAG